MKSSQFIIDMYKTGVESGNPILIEIATQLAGEDLSILRAFAGIDLVNMPAVKNPVELTKNQVYNAILNYLLPNDDRHV